MKTEEFYDEKYRRESEKLQSFKLKALEYLPVDKSYHILDLGCGTGEMATRMQAMGHVVQGIDISSEAIQKLEQKGIKGMAMDLNKGISFKDESFGIVCLSEVLEHLSLPENILNEIYRVLRPDRRLILTVPNSAFSYGEYFIYLVRPAQMFSTLIIYIFLQKGASKNY